MSYNKNSSISQGNIYNLSGSSITISGSLTGSEISGTVAQFTTLSASVISASQYIGPISGTGGGPGIPGGTNQTVQFNSGSEFSGSTNLIYDYNNNTLSGTTAQFTSITGSLSGNSTTATTLQTSRNINGTSFNGSSAITTANWGTSRTITVGNTDKSVNGSTNISWTLAEIGAAQTGSSNTFNGINEFTTNYITASAGITGSDAKFTSITGSHAGSGAGLINIPNGALVNSNITIGNTSISLGGTSTVLSGLTSVTASNIVVQTDLTVNGTASIAHLNTVSQSSLLVGDKYITILSGGVDHTGIDGAGFLWGSSSGPGETTSSLGEHAHVLYDSSRDALKIFPGLYISGSLSTNVGVLTSNTTLDGTQHILLVSASNADITLTLPTAAAAPYRHYNIKKTDSTSYKIIVSGSSSQTIDGLTGRSINVQYESLSIVNDGINSWFIL